MRKLAMARRTIATTTHDTPDSSSGLAKAHACIAGSNSDQTYDEDDDIQNEAAGENSLPRRAHQNCDGNDDTQTYRPDCQDSAGESHSLDPISVQLSFDQEHVIRNSAALTAPNQYRRDAENGTAEKNLKAIDSGTVPENKTDANQVQIDSDEALKGEMQIGQVVYQIAVAWKRLANYANRDAISTANSDATAIANRDNTLIVDGDDTGISNRDDTGITDGDDTGTSNRDDTRITNRDESGITNTDDTRITDRDDTGITDRDDTGITNREATALTNRDGTRITNRDDTGITNRDDTGITNRDHTEITKRDDTGGDDTGITNRDDTGITGGDDTGISNRDDTGITNRDDTGITNRDDTGIANGDDIGAPPLNLSMQEKFAADIRRRATLKAESGALTNRDATALTNRDATALTNRDATALTNRDDNGTANRDDSGAPPSDLSMQEKFAAAIRRRATLKAESRAPQSVSVGESAAGVLPSREGPKTKTATVGETGSDAVSTSSAVGSTNTGTATSDAERQKLVAAPLTDEATKSAVRGFPPAVLAAGRAGEIRTTAKTKEVAVSDEKPLAGTGSSGMTIQEQLAASLARKARLVKQQDGSSAACNTAGASATYTEGKATTYNVTKAAMSAPTSALSSLQQLDSPTVAPMGSRLEPGTVTDDPGTAHDAAGGGCVFDLSAKSSDAGTSQEAIETSTDVPMRDMFPSIIKTGHTSRNHLQGKKTVVICEKVQVFK